MTKFKNAFVSVSDKTGLVEFLRPLVAQGLRVVSTGGTAQALIKAGLKVVDVSEQTGFPEVMGGRVKTLHPRIHMPLLSRLNNPEDAALLNKENLQPFDLLIVNLYPFEETLKRTDDLAERIENIDIGGPSLLRGAAKNHERVTVLVDPRDYEAVLNANEVTHAMRQNLAAKVFAHCSSYDAMIAETLAPDETFAQTGWGGELVQPLRYGENPHQKAAWFRRRGDAPGWHQSKILQGKELSYNNLLDLDSSVGLLRMLPGPSCVAVKHNNPCGAASRPTLAEAVKACLASDPVSVFGGIIALSRQVDVATAQLLVDVFLECIVAPSFNAEALTILAKKKNLRLLAWPEWESVDQNSRLTSISGGFLQQEPDKVLNWSPSWTVLMSDKSQSSSLSDKTKSDLSFAWATVAQLKSNAIAIVSNQQTLGLGMGQVNRVDAVDLAIERWRKFHPKQGHAVLASDAFFPFADSIEKIAAAGIEWVIQPGGSQRDSEVFAKAKELGVHLVITGQRHFRH